MSKHNARKSESLNSSPSKKPRTSVDVKCEESVLTLPSRCFICKDYQTCIDRCKNYVKNLPHPRLRITPYDLQQTKSMLNPIDFPYETTYPFNSKAKYNNKKLPWVYSNKEGIAKRQLQDYKNKIKFVEERLEDIHIIMEELLEKAGDICHIVNCLLDK